MIFFPAVVFDSERAFSVVFLSQIEDDHHLELAEEIGVVKHLYRLVNANGIILFVSRKGDQSLGVEDIFEHRLD